MVSERSVAMAIQVSDHQVALRNILACYITSKTIHLDPLPTMVSTLRAYVNDNVDLATELIEQTIDDIVERIGGVKHIYYGIMRSLVYKLLIDNKTTSRCIILKGVTSSGKSTIANYLAGIFISYSHRNALSLFDAAITPKEANVQLLVMDEANLSNLFSKLMMADTKKLLEGGGKAINVKFKDPFVGFVNA